MRGSILPLGSCIALQSSSNRVGSPRLPAALVTHPMACHGRPRLHRYGLYAGSACAALTIRHDAGAWPQARCRTLRQLIAARLIHTLCSQLRFAPGCTDTAFLTDGLHLNCSETPQGEDPARVSGGVLLTRHRSCLPVTNCTNCDRLLCHAQRSVRKGPKIVDHAHGVIVSSLLSVHSGPSFPTRPYNPPMLAQRPHL